MWLRQSVEDTLKNIPYFQSLIKATRTLFIMGFATLDWIVLASYFLVIGAIAWWVIQKSNNSAQDYFLAGRHMGWFVIGAAIFASNIGSEHVVGLAGTTYEHGMAMAYYELHSWLVLLLGWVFIPFYLRSGVFTMPEFLERRYNPTARWMLSVFSLLAYVLTKVSATVYAGAVVFDALMGIPFWTGALITVILTGFYTMLGGLRAVVYTETLQAFVLLIGSIVIMVIGLGKVGGMEGLYETVGRTSFDMFRPPSDPDFPWPGVIVGGTIVGIWYWCTDQYIVQRTLAAANVKEARRGTIFAGLLKLAPVFIFMIPGLIAYALAQDPDSGFAVVNSAGEEQADLAFPAMVSFLLPVGLRGLVVGGLLAALMSSLAAVFNSCSTLFTMDIYRQLKPDSGDKELVTVGRIATGVVVLLGILWIPIMERISSQLYVYLQNVQAYLAPPIFCAFVLGVAWKRINGQGAVAGLITGFVLGLTRLLSEAFLITRSAADELLANGEAVTRPVVDGLFASFIDLNFLYLAIVITSVISLVMVLVSLATPAPDPEQIRGLTFGSTTDEQKAETRKSWGAADVFWSLVVIAAIIGVMIWLRG